MLLKGRRKLYFLQT